MLLLNSFSFQILLARRMVGFPLEFQPLQLWPFSGQNYRKLGIYSELITFSTFWLLSKIGKVQCPVPQGVVLVYAARVNTVICRGTTRYSFFYNRSSNSQIQGFFIVVILLLKIPSFFWDLPWLSRDVLTTNPLASPKALILLIAPLTVFHTTLTISSSLKHFLATSIACYLGFLRKVWQFHWPLFLGHKCDTKVQTRVHSSFLIIYLPFILMSSLLSIHFLQSVFSGLPSFLITTLISFDPIGFHLFCCLL